MPIPPIPPECQALADDVAALESRLEAVRGEAAGAVGEQAWNKLAELAALRRQLERRRAELDSCVRTHAGAVLPCEFVRIEIGGGRAVGARAAHLWDMSLGPPTLTETVPLEGVGFSFAGPIPADTLGITVTAAEITPSKGPEFRSGAVTAPPPADPRLRLEAVIGPTVTLTDEDISRWLAGATVPSQQIDVAGLGTVEVNVGSVGGTIVSSGLQLTAAGTMSVPAVMIQNSPFSASAGVGLVPSTSPDALLPVDLTIVAPPAVELAGPLAAFGAALNLAISAGLFDPVLAQLRPIVDRELRGMVSSAFSLLDLPTATLSVREIAIEPPAITFQPALGAVGTALSTFHAGPELLLPLSH